MTGFSHSGKNDEIVNKDYKSKGIAVTDASEVIAKASTENLNFRQLLTITNDGPDDVFYGPPGSSIADRDRLTCYQFMSLPFGDCINVTFICNTGESATIKVQEAS